jgi:hypothetical protein
VTTVNHDEDQRLIDALARSGGAETADTIAQLAEVDGDYAKAALDGLRRDPDSHIVARIHRGNVVYRYVGPDADERKDQGRPDRQR